MHAWGATGGGRAAAALESMHTLGTLLAGHKCLSQPSPAKLKSISLPAGVHRLPPRPHSLLFAAATGGASRESANSVAAAAAVAGLGPCMHRVGRGRSCARRYSLESHWTGAPTPLAISEPFTCLWRTGNAAGA